MSGRHRAGITPNLFPFLAVLICTLGTLILVLALIAPNAGDVVAATTEPDQSADGEEAIRQEAIRQLAEADAEVDRRLGEARWQRDKIVKLRDEQTAEIDERRVKQAHLEDHLRRLRDELKKLESEVNATQDKSKIKAVSQAAIDGLQAKIADEKSKIEKLQSEMQSKVPRIIIVPHKGPNGTDRRPIYIECRANGVYIQPGNIGIDTKYLEPDTPGPNPLDAALRAFRLHAMQDYGDTVAPYPLIVVRPDGIETYGVVRYAMKGWDDQFGYELVPEDVKLAFPEPDAVLTGHVEQAIAQAVMQQRSIAQNGYGRGGGGSGSGGGGNGRGRGNGNRTSDDPANEDSLAGSHSGNSAGINDASPTNGKYSSGQSQAGQSSPGQSSPGQSQGGSIPRPASELPVLSSRNMNPGSQNSFDRSFTGSGTNHSKGLSQLNAKQAAAAASANADKGAAQLDAEAAELAHSPSGTTNKKSKSGSQGLSYAGLSDNDSQDSAYGEDADPNAPNGDKFAPQSDIASRSKAPSASTDPNAPIGGTQATGSASSDNPAGTAPQSLDKNQTAGQPGGAQSQTPPPPNVKIDVNGQTPPKSLVKRGGNNWALPPDVATMVGTSMVRMIRVECYDDRIVLLPEGGRGATNVYGFSDGDIDRASLELATAIRDRVGRWGAAMPGGKWHPLVEVNVAPGGEVRYRQLQRLMDGSGVELQTKGAAK